MNFVVRGNNGNGAYIGNDEMVDGEYYYLRRDGSIMTCLRPDEDWFDTREDAQAFLDKWNKPIPNCEEEFPQ